MDSHILQKNLDVAESICNANLEGKGQEVLIQGSLELTGPPVQPIREPWVQWETQSEKLRWRAIRKDTLSTPVSIHTNTCMYMHPYVHVCTHANQHTYAMYPCMHTYNHTSKSRIIAILLATCDSKSCMGGIPNSKRAHAGWDTREAAGTRKPESGMMRDGAGEAEKGLSRNRRGLHRLLEKGAAQSLILAKTTAFFTAKILHSI